MGNQQYGAILQMRPSAGSSATLSVLVPLPTPPTLVLTIPPKPSVPSPTTPPAASPTPSAM